MPSIYTVMNDTSNTSDPRSISSQATALPDLHAGEVDPTARKVEPGVLPHLVDFFDADHNGAISIPETVRGLKRLGIGWIASTVFGLGINFGIAGRMRGNPFALRLDQIHKGKHPSDTDVVDEQGKFRRHRFGEVFRKYGGPNGDGLTGGALARLWIDDVVRDLQPSSVFGATAAAGELGLFYYVGAQKSERGLVLTKQRLLDLYTRPELFEQIAQEQEKARAERNKSVSGQLVNAFHTWIL